MLLRVPTLCEQTFRFDNMIRENDSGLRCVVMIYRHDILLVIFVLEVIRFCYGDDGDI